ncbi:MAG: DUF2577 domain-containing protein [Oscillibacter sp.]|nr:DUF2577 domain-containing protein [Oscillibacter sp.]
MANTGAEATSIKQLFQSMMGEGPQILIGTVTGTNPLRIQIEGDEKLVIGGSNTIIPQHLTDYTTKATFELDEGTIDSVTEGNGSHTHTNGEHGGHGIGGTGRHTHGPDGTHPHHLVTFALTRGTLTVHNALQSGEMVLVLSINNGKRYFVLDRMGG